MSQVVIGDILPRTQATAIAGQTVFMTNWTANYSTDVDVYYTPNGQAPDDFTQKLATSAYNVTFIGALQQVQVTLITPASAGDIVTIVRNTPAARSNLYSNTNFTPSMLNNDFGILTLVDQQNQLVNQLVGPRYNYSAQIINVVDTILPLLGANQIWAKNPTNSEIIAVDLNEVISGGTVTQVNTGLGLTGGPITDAGTISFAAMPANTFWGNITGASALPTQVTTSYFLQSAKNLSDLTNVPAAQANIGLQIGVNVQAYSAALTSIAGLVTTANNMIYTTAANTYAVIAPAADSALITSPSNVPSFSQTLPTTVQSNITQLGAQSQALNMNAHLINNVSTPIASNDAANKAYVDSAGGAFLKLDGSTPMLGQIDMNTHKIINLTNPSSAQDAANKAYVDSTVGAYLPLNGGTMSGVIDMGNHKIINLTDPSTNQDAVNLEYLNTALGNYLAKSGGTMTGQINMGSNKIISLLDPTNPQDAATKNYVDSVAVGFTVKQACAVATTANLTATYANGASGIGATLTNSGALAALVIDGYTVNTNDRILVKDQSSTLQNGIYVATNVGSGAVAWILTRSTDFDQPAEIQPGDLVIINNGTTNAGTSWLETATVSAVGTDPILFSQFTFSASAVLLKANNLNDVANKTTSFNNISPLTTKGDLIGYSTQNVRIPVGASNGMVFQVDSTAATGLSWSTATYPKTTTINQILYSSASNVVSGISTLAGGVLVTDASNVPQFLTNPAATGRILQSGNAAIPTWSTSTYPSGSVSSGLFLISDGTNFVASTSTIPTSAGATANKVLLSDGINYVLSTPTFPNASASSGKIIISDGTNWIASTPTYPNASATLGKFLISDGTNFVSSTSTIPSSAGLTANKVLLSDGTNYVLSTPTFPNASATSGKIIVSDGTNWTASTPTFPNASASSGKFIRSDGTNWIASTPTLPTTAGTARTLLVSDGTNFINTTETWAVPGTSGHVLTSDGTNWISSAPTGSGTVNSGLINQLAYYAAAGTAVSGLTTANSSILVTNGSGVPAWGTTLPSFTTGTITFSPTTGGLVGTTTNDNASSGNVGEYKSTIVLAGSAVNLSSNNSVDIASVSLGAGDWDVWGEGWPAGPSGTSYTQIAFSLSTASNTNVSTPGDNQARTQNGQSGALVVGTNIFPIMPVGPIRISVNTTTSVFLDCFSVFTVHTGAAYGKIAARRVR